MLGIGFSFHPFGTGKHNFGHIPDPPEPDESECTDEYAEGFCEYCDHFEQCLETWRKDEDA